MRKHVSIALLILVALLATAAPSFAWSRGHHHFHGARVFVGVGPVWWGPYPYWYYPPPYYVYNPPPVVVQEPPVYVQQPAQSAPAQSPAAEAYWYYCASAKGYYPSVQTCPEPWVKVPPRQD